MLTRTLSALVLLALPAGAEAQFAQLMAVDGVSGHEEAVREAVRAQLPGWAKPRVDEIGNLIVTIGSGSPHIAFVAPLDEPGYVVSRITDDGYLRLHRHTARTSHPLGDQFFVGQPVAIRTSRGRPVTGVTATPSTHLRALSPASEVQRIKTVDDLWVDVGAANPQEVAQLGIRMLDPVSLRERVQPLANGRIAGPAAQLRAGAQVPLELLRTQPAPPSPSGTLTFAWVTQSQYGGRGLERLARQIVPDRAYVFGRGSSMARPPAAWEKVKIEALAVPAMFAETPVETVTSADIAQLAAKLLEAAGLRPDPPRGGIVLATSGPVAPETTPFGILRDLIETEGVSGHEEHVREEVLRRIKNVPWAAPKVDEKGNVSVSFGQGGKALVFVAHMDEVGFEITTIADDGTAGVRPRGGMYLSLFEGRPVFVRTPKGVVNAVLRPRGGYESAKTSQPEAEGLSVYFGTASAAETRALGVAEGQPLTIRKVFAPLAGTRATGRAMDDRAGSTALLLALQQIDPEKVHNRVTFAWAVEEETGLIGAAFIATRMKPDYAFAVDTFVSTDAPLDVQHLAHAELGKGAVLRGMDSRTVVPAATIDRIVTLAADASIPLQIGVTQGGTDASAFSAGGAIDVGLSWPGRYSHSPVEVIDRRDLESLAKLIATLALEF